jgi:hypothetical protein
LTERRHRQRDRNVDAIPTLEKSRVFHTRSHEIS